MQGVLVDRGNSTKVNANSFTYVNATVGTSIVSSVVVGEAITGVSTKNIINVNIFKNRIWLVQKNSLSAWYLPALAIQGAAVEFPLSGKVNPAGIPPPRLVLPKPVDTMQTNYSFAPAIFCF